MLATEKHRNRWRTLAVLSLSLVVIGLDNTVLNVALPSLQEDLGVWGSTLQWVVDAYMLVFAGLLLAIGNLGDRHGRKRVLQLGLGVFGAASVAGAFAETGAQLIAARAAMESARQRSCPPRSRSSWTSSRRRSAVRPSASGRGWPRSASASGR